MSIAVAFRWTVADRDVALKCAKSAETVWKREGATGLRTFAPLFGPNVGQLVVLVEFEDLAAFAKARDAVRESKEAKQWRMELTEAGNVLVDVSVFEEAK